MIAQPPIASPMSGRQTKPKGKQKKDTRKKPAAKTNTTKPPSLSSDLVEVLRQTADGRRQTASWKHAAAPK
jgi:hypothetical protein